MNKLASLQNAKVIPRAKHHVSRKHISDNALKTLYRLNNHGYEAYLVGGCVRDLLMNHTPKDFDIATNASPEQIKKVFGNCRLIGRRFRLAHIYFRHETLEVATFRAGHEGAEAHVAHSRDGIIVRDNVYGTVEEDAFRRDFTINALYYNVNDFSIIDFTDGVKDLSEKKLRIIGDAEKRYQEDPVRIIRAIRFAAKFDLKIMPRTVKPIKSMSHLIQQVSPSRLIDELIKLFHTGCAKRMLPLLVKYGVFEILLPQTHSLIQKEKKSRIVKMLQSACNNTDARLKQEKPISVAFLFAVLLWHPVESRSNELHSKGMPPMQALMQASREITRKQSQTTALPRRSINCIYEIWQLQYRFNKKQRKNIYRALTSLRFRAGFDLLLLRAEGDKSLKDSAKWWEKIQTLNKKQQDEMIKALHKK